MSDSLRSQVGALTAATVARLGGSPYQAAARQIADRLDGPLRVAIAGRVKAGKSTLLNALVGERLAPTDAGECTRLVTAYQRGAAYEVHALCRDGSRHALGFRRDTGALQIELGAVVERDVARLEVQWPTSSLSAMTLIDTPGLESINDENSRRTREFLQRENGSVVDADAVVFLMRHLHANDVGFLDAFMDRTVGAASPVNAIAVLSRADEIGGGRRDALDSARRIARRYRSDSAVRHLVADVVPVVGLLAETGLTLREDEVTGLRAICGVDPAVLELMLLGAEPFCASDLSDVPVESRRMLLDRFGMFGMRVVLDLMMNEGLTTAAQLGPRLVAESGFDQFRQHLVEYFTPRARVLQCRSVLADLRVLAEQLRRDLPEVAADVDRSAERIEAGSVDFSQVRCAHLVAAGEVVVTDDERGDLERVLNSTGPAALGLANTATRADVRQAALEGADRWRRRSAHPATAPMLAEVFDTAARICEHLHADSARIEE